MNSLQPSVLDLQMTVKTVLVDAREFVPGKTTGIGRFLEGLVGALTDADPNMDIVLASFRNNSVPKKLFEKRTELKQLPSGLLSSERALSNLTKHNVSLFLSPYPKIPLFGTYCLTVNTVHDVFEFTLPTYEKRLRRMIDRYRLRQALNQASLTWYVSEWSLQETLRYFGIVGKDPRVRHSAIHPRFNVGKSAWDHAVLKKYDLLPGYILLVGNGLPHKNLGVLLKIAPILSREIVIVGVPQENQRRWRQAYPQAQPTWIEYVEDDHLPAIMRHALCLTQPSTAEGYGFPPLEAMACGVPVVVSDIPVLLECTGGNALTADPQDSKLWQTTIESLDDSDTYHIQVKKGLEWVEPLRGSEGWERHIMDIQELLSPR